MRVFLAAMFLVVVTNALAEQQGPLERGAVPGIKAAKGISYTVWATGLAGPRGLLADPAGGLWVAEQRAGRVVKIGNDGKATRIGGEFQNPHDLERDARGNLYVAETRTDRVMIISPAGVVDTYAENLNGPVDLAFNPAGELLVCEYHGKKVVALKSPTERRILVQGFTPHGLAFGKTGATIVNDWSGDRIVEVGPGGEVKIIAAGVKEPVGVTIGRSGDIYVPEPKTGKFLRIRPDGTRTVLLEGLSGPRDPVFDAQGNLYIAETDGGRILKLSGDFLEVTAGTGTSRVLDGKTFVTQTGEKGKKADHEDIISFRDGRFISEACVKYGFEEKTFTATADGEAIRFRAENVSPKLGIMLWEGTVKGDDIEATSTWIRDRWYWKIKKEYWYRGKLKE